MPGALVLGLSRQRVINAKASNMFQELFLTAFFSWLLLTERESTPQQCMPLYDNTGNMSLLFAVLPSPTSRARPWSFKRNECSADDEASYGYDETT